MIVLPIEAIDDIDIKYRFSHGNSAGVFRTMDNRVLKRYYMNLNYIKMLHCHKEGFYDYLLELEKIDHESLITPDTIYLNDKEQVKGYSYPYEVGTSMGDLYPKTNMDKLTDAIDRFMSTLYKLDSKLTLSDMHYYNILYTGDIKLIDLDFCTLSNDLESNNKHNYKIMNKNLFYAIFGIESYNEVVINSKYLKELYESFNNGDFNVNTFLSLYKEYVSNLSNREIKYLRDYRNGLITDGKVRSR